MTVAILVVSAVGLVLALLLFPQPTRYIRGFEYVQFGWTVMVGVLLTLLVLSIVAVAVGA